MSSPLHELRKTLHGFKLNKLAVGSDSRNRTMLSPFSAKTGRNQPSTTKYAFGPAKWVRGLIKPKIGSALAHCDWSSQELAVAAAQVQVWEPPCMGLLPAAALHAVGRAQTASFLENNADTC